jgi:hypothetical protein
MAIVESKVPAASGAIDSYVRSQKHDGRPISIREAVQALRDARIRCYVSDRELAEMVAATAIGHGRDVAFDWTVTEE